MVNTWPYRSVTAARPRFRMSSLAISDERGGSKLRFGTKIILVAPTVTPADCLLESKGEKPHECDKCDTHVFVCGGRGEHKLQNPLRCRPPEGSREWCRMGRFSTRVLIKPQSGRDRYMSISWYTEYFRTEFLRNRRSDLHETKFAAIVSAQGITWNPQTRCHGPISTKWRSLGREESSLN